MALTPSDTWQSPCGVAYRWLTDGRFEVQNLGFPAWDLGSAHAQQIIKLWSDWGSAIQAAADKYQVPASWLVGIMKIESGGKPGLRSSAGACGLMQFMPFTCKMYGRDCNYYDVNPADQIPDAIDLLLKMASSHGGSILSAVKAYNGGGICSDTGMASSPGILGMYGQNDYVGNFVRAANTFVALGLPPPESADPFGGSGVGKPMQGMVVFGILGFLSYMFADIHWQLSDRILGAFGLDRWNT